MIRGFRKEFETLIFIRNHIIWIKLGMIYPVNPVSFRKVLRSGLKRRPGRFSEMALYFLFVRYSSSWNLFELKVWYLIRMGNLIV